MRWIGCLVVLLVGCNSSVSEPEAATPAAYESPVLPVTYTAPPTAGELQEMARIRRALPREYRSDFLESKEEFYPTIKRELRSTASGTETSLAPTLRSAARHLDTLAAQHEDQQEIDEADSLREIAQQLRLIARKWATAEEATFPGVPDAEPENEK